MWFNKIWSSWISVLRFKKNNDKMNYRVEIIKSITDDFKALVLGAEKELENKSKVINEFSQIINVIKK